MKNVKIVSPLSENLDYVLYNINNYKPTILNSSQEILTKFVNVIVNYMKFISEKINLKNKTYYKFILERGIHTIIHVFTMVFYYTRNLDLTYYHSQKAYYFYIEFIEQISDESVTFLQLNSRDAILFVYKKTIYELNSDYIKNKVKQTVLERYGVDHISKSKEIQAIKRKNCMNKYGVEFAVQHPEFAEKACTNGFLMKEYTLPSGKIIKVQGYEPFALNHIINVEKINEDDIITGCKNVPTI